MKLKKLLEMANKPLSKDLVEEDGTVADLGAVPTGHIKNKKETMHSLCAHDIDEEHGYDDGW